MLVIKIDDISSVEAVESNLVKVILRRFPDSVTLTPAVNVRYGKDKITRLIAYNNVLYQSSLKSTLRKTSESEMEHLSSRIANSKYLYDLENLFGQ